MVFDGYGAGCGCGLGYGCGPGCQCGPACSYNTGQGGRGFALIVVLFILLIIVGAAYVY